MSDIIVTGASGYATGGIDSATVLVSNVSTISARHPNGCASAIVQLETILGNGPSLKGSHADLVARLAVALGANGKVELGDPNKLTGVLTVPNGGTSLATLPEHRVLMGNLAGSPIFSAGMLFQGPVSCGASSSLVHGGAGSFSGSVTMNGLHFFTSFNQTSGTITLGAGTHRLIIMSSDSIIISGGINAGGAGSAAGTGGGGGGVAGTGGGAGTAQPGGGGGGGQSSVAGGAGGGVTNGGFTIANGGSGGGVGSGGSAGTSIGSTAMPFSSPYSVYGGAGGGGGAGVSGDNGGNGGTGGGSIVLIAPTIVLAAGSALTTSANSGGGSSAQAGSGGGGGAGNIFMFCRSYIDGGCTFTLNGGAGGTGSARNGGAGANGIRQIWIYE